MTEKRLICVFGCGGDRDQSKRPLMGGIAAGLSDLVIITSDNSRTENPLDIIDQILVGLSSLALRRFDPEELCKDWWNLSADSKGYLIEPDRKKAIFLSAQASRSGDTIIIAGKGHETYQIIGDQQLFFDDRQTAAAALKAIGC